MIPNQETTLLVQMARRGCRRSFAKLWNEYADGLRAAVVRLLPRHLADDVLQEVALAALAGIGGMRGQAGAHFEAWLRAIARNRASSALVRQQRWRAIQAADDVALATAISNESGGLQGAERREVRAALRQLPRCYRSPLRLRFLLGLSPPEIAARLGMTQGSVRVNLCRGLQRLRGGQDLAG